MKLLTNDELFNLIENKPDKRILKSELEQILGYKTIGNLMFHTKLSRLNKKRKELNLSILKSCGRGSPQAFYYLTN